MQKSISYIIFLYSSKHHCPQNHIHFRIILLCFCFSGQIKKSDETNWNSISNKGLEFIGWYLIYMFMKWLGKHLVLLCGALEVYYCSNVLAALLTKPFLLILYGMITKPLHCCDNLFIYSSLCSKTVVEAASVMCSTFVPWPWRKSLRFNGVFVFHKSYRGCAWSLWLYISVHWSVLVSNIFWNFSMIQISHLPWRR